MDWREVYKDKIVSAAEAVSGIKSGDKIIYGDWLGEPPALVDALIARAPELRNVEIIHGISPGPNADTNPAYAESFHHTALFVGVLSRPAVYEGKVEYIGGTTFSQWPNMFAKSSKLNPHWALIQVGEPDENGLCSYGIDCSFTEPAARTAAPGQVVVQINPNFPNVGGKKFDLKDADYIVYQESPLYTIGRAAIDEKTQKIADYCASLVEDGATIQLGIGALPDAIARNLTDKKGLGVHSETFTEAMMELYEAGVITNENKTLHPGKFVFAQLAGSEKLYKWADEHGDLMETYPVDYTNEPTVIMHNYKQTSINACLQVDLKGQVNSETVKGKQFSGIGGQLDHVRGAQMSKGGKSILALNATAKNDTISRIVPFLDPGNVVTVGRYDVQYVVTEYGIADLKYKTERERAEALIAIAHPKFREELTNQAKEMGLIPKEA